MIIEDGTGSAKRARVNKNHEVEVSIGSIGSEVFGMRTQLLIMNIQLIVIIFLLAKGI
jgi:hypothetical protein